MTTQHPEELRLADELEAEFAQGRISNHTGRKAATELRSLHTRIAELEAQLEAIGAGAGSEPIAWLVCTEEGDPDMVFLSQHEAQQYLEDDERPTPLYTHPSPTEGMVGVWISVDERLPEPGVPVLLDIGEKYPIRAMWAAKHTVEACDDDTDWGEYVEEDDMYYAPEGWYEWNQCEDNDWRVTETPRAWAPLPPTTAAGSGKGVSNADQA